MENIEKTIEQLKNKIDGFDQKFNDINEMLIDLYKMLELINMTTTGVSYRHKPKLIQDEMNLIGMPEVKFNKEEATIVKNGEEVFKINSIDASISLTERNEFIVKHTILGKVLKESTYPLYFNIYSDIDNPIKFYKWKEISEYLHKQNKDVGLFGFFIACKPNEKIMVDIVEDLDAIEKN